ncbi:NAD(P)H-dependent flavin oxidoreductase [Methylobacterium segetis]|uniref:NAD(P)H-dependent flavin oxidoreductase n=1 Tax=Methylobacterium segetis TaxID=2488750 RepID=UPI00104A126E|nr:nitronate monooxygenase [Methylobacterium segetis]
MPLRNRVTELLGIEHPILLAPMDGVSGGRLAAAVSRAGGLGLLGGGYGDETWLRSEWPLAGNARIGCGFITWSLARIPHVLPTALDHRPAAIMLSFGDPRPFAPAIREAGAKLICQVQSLGQAQEAVEAGADILVVQGTEAGGHGQSRPLMPLLLETVDAWPGTPILAAGGIADGRGLAAALMLGAEGVLMGTRFYASQEADGHPEAKRRIVDATGEDTVRSIVFDLSRRNVWPAPYTGRVLRNRHSERWLGREAELMQNVEEVARAYAEARGRGDFDIAAVIAGQACGLIHDLPPAGEIVERIIAQARALLGERAPSAPDDEAPASEAAK